MQQRYPQCCCTTAPCRAVSETQNGSCHTEKPADYGSLRNGDPAPCTATGGIMMAGCVCLLQCLPGSQQLQHRRRRCDEILPALVAGGIPLIPRPHDSASPQSRRGTARG